MLSTLSAYRAHDLAERLRAGVLDGLDPIDLGDGAFLAAPIAARVVLADLAHLTQRVEEGAPVRPWRWRLIEQQLARISLVLK